MSCDLHAEVILYIGEEAKVIRGVVGRCSVKLRLEVSFSCCYGFPYPNHFDGRFLSI